MGCDRYAPFLHGYADGELDAANVAELEEHLSVCRCCHEALIDLQEAKDSIWSAQLRFEAPHRLRKRVDEICRERIAHRHRPWIVSGLSGALAASLALLFIVPVETEPTIEHELVESHVRSMLADHLIDVATSDRHVVKPWFNGKIDFAPRVPDLSSKGFPLVGGRLDYVGDKVVAAIVYRRRRHVINLFAWPQPDAVRSEDEMQGYSVSEWSEGGLRYAAVSDVGQRDLASFREAFRQTAHGANDKTEQ